MQGPQYPKKVKGPDSTNTGSFKVLNSMSIYRLSTPRLNRRPP